MEITFAMLLDLLKETDFEGDITKITEETSFEEAGLDSLETMNLFLEIEEKFHITLADPQFEFIDSFGELMKFIKKNK